MDPGVMSDTFQTSSSRRVYNARTGQYVQKARRKSQVILEALRGLPDVELVLCYLLLM